MDKFIEVLKAILFGIIEGVTEWLPISSTGHIILLEEFMSLGQSDEFFNMFKVVIQLGAILAVVFIYFRKLNPFALSKTKEEKKDTWILWFKVLIGVLPVAILGIFLDDLCDLWFSNWWTVSITLIVYGILFIVIEIINQKRYKIDDDSNNSSPRFKTVKDITFKYAFLIGLFQVLSLIPGTSRSGATILGALILGCSREAGAEFSFFMAIPIMFGASFVKLLKFGFVYTNMEIAILLIASIVAFVVSLFSIKFLVSFVKKHDFKFFGYYRIVLGIIVIIYFTAKALM